MRRLVIVSNRLPAGSERTTTTAGGLSVALRDAKSRLRKLWFGWSGRTTSAPTQTVPAVTHGGWADFAAIDLSEQDHAGFYVGFANSTLWPLLHYRSVLTEYRRQDLGRYLAVNGLFAEALRPLLEPDDLIWVHDYHLFTLGRALRGQQVTTRVGFFLHVPFPPPDVFSVLPRWEDLIRALDAYDVIAVQTPKDAAHLNQTMAAAGVTPRVEAIPAGIDPVGFAKLARRAAKSRDPLRLADSITERAFVIGVDRLDYSKGLPQRFRGFAGLLQRFPEHRGKVTMLQVAPISRSEVAQYRALRRELDELVGRVNGEYAEFDWTPLRYLTRSVPRHTLAGFYRLARVGLVTPLRDGMNLVAKEYVAAQDPANPGVLVLSRFAGVADDMPGAVLVNPVDPDETAEALHTALSMEIGERQRRWHEMMAAVERTSASNWANAFVSRLESADSGRLRAVV
ncbi:MAG: alpha,alpha-trehalose-phosphate synthase (UDP-forming) [Acetobacteraceae bacterium]